MNKILSFFSLLLLIPFTNAQTIKINRMNAYFNYNLNDVNIQIEQIGENGKIKINLIHRNKEKNDSIVLIKTILNKNYQLIDSFLVYDRLGRKLIEGFYSDSINSPKERAKTVHPFYKIVGTTNGKYTIYDYESDELNAKRRIHSIENYNYGKKEGEFIQYFSGSEQVNIISNYKNNLLDGEYISYYKTGAFYEKGMFKKGFKNGAWTSFGENNQPSKYEQYQDGKKHGQYKEWFENGNISVVTNYQDGLIHSFYYSYYPNKKKKDSCTYSLGKLQGKSVTYYENGQLQKLGTYKEGRPVNDYKYWSETGQLLQHFPYQFGYLNGTVLKYYPNGKLSEKYGMTNDTLNGDYSTFYENGKVKTKANFKMGVIQKGALFFDENGEKMNIRYEEISEDFLPPNVIEERVDMTENNFFAESYKIELVHPFTKDELKIWKKIKGKEIKVQIAKDGSFELILDKDVFNSNIILKAREVITKHLMVKPYKLNGYPVGCTVSIILQ